MLPPSPVRPPCESVQSNNAAEDSAASRQKGKVWYVRLMTSVSDQAHPSSKPAVMEHHEKLTDCLTETLEVTGVLCSETRPPLHGH